jgi:hypothetical protein
VPDFSESGKIGAWHVADAFGTRPKITEYWDVGDHYSVAIAPAVDSPTEGITSYSSVSFAACPGR